LLHVSVKEMYCLFGNDYSSIVGRRVGFRSVTLATAD
jgi:hypothetical protein